MGSLGSAAVVLHGGFLLRREMQVLIAKTQMAESRSGGSRVPLRL